MAKAGGNLRQGGGQPGRNNTTPNNGARLHTHDPFPGVAPWAGMR